MHVAKVKTRNRYQALTRNEEEKEEDEEGQVERDHHVRDVKTNRVTGRKWKDVKLLPVPAYPKTDLISTSRKFTERSPIEPVSKSSQITDSDSEWKVQKSPKKGVNLVEKLIAAATRAETAVCQMTFHLTDASKILASVNKMTEKGNEVIFNKARSFIKSPSGRKAFLKKRNGVYVLDVIFFNGDEAVRGEVIIDSGAADHVMPRGMLEAVITREKEAGIKFVAADGAEIGNYGRKDVQFVPADFWEEEFGSPFTGRA